MKIRYSKWVSLATCIVVLSSLLAGCATSQPTATSPKESPAAVKAPSEKVVAPSATPKSDTQPKYGGILAVSHEADPPSLDLQQETAFSVTAAVQSAYNGLVQFDQISEKIVGDLAESWESSEGGKVITFRLQKNARWHDGKPVTAEDIKFSLLRTVKPPRGIRAPRSEELAMMKSVDVVDDHTVKVTLEYPSAYFIVALTIPLMVMYSKSYVEAKGDLKKDVMGSGPFKFKRYDAGVSIEMVRNPDYFRKGLPYLDGLAFYVIKDRGTRAAAFRTGQVRATGPGVAGIYPGEVKALQSSMPNAVLTRYGGLAWANVTINAKRAPWSDVRVRQAASLAVDRGQGLQALYMGEGRIGSYIAGNWGTPQEELLKKPGYRSPKDADLAEAKRLLADAGYAGGFKTTMTVTQGYENIAEFFQNQWTQIGIQATLDVKDMGVRTTLLNKGDFDLEARVQVLHLADPSNTARYYKSVKGEDLKQNFGRFEDARVDQLYDQQERTQDPAERLKLSRELDARLLETAPRIVICYYDYILGTWPEVKGRVLKTGFYPEFKYESVWLAK